MQSSFRYRRSCLAAVVVSVVLGVLVPIGSASAGSVILPDPCTLLTSLASSDAGAALGISGGRPTLYSSSPPVLWCDEVVNGSRGTFAVGLTTSHAGAKDGLPDAKGHTTYPSGLGSGATLEEDPRGEDTHGAIPGSETLRFHSGTVFVGLYISNNNATEILAVGKAIYKLLGGGVLSVTEVSPGSGPLQVDVKVSLQDSATDRSGCDPKATYDFTDSDLSSTLSLGSCRFRLTFDAPATGIYTVGLKATSKDGGEVGVSLDQFGDTVDGQFPLVIDSCPDPTENVPGVDALDNPNGSDCAVSIGDWDGDASGVPDTVIAGVESEPGLELTPIAASSIDPSDWSADDLASLEHANAGWLPTGEHGPLDGRAVLAASESADDVFHGLPSSWDGAGTKLTPSQLQETPKNVTVISAHGDWLTDNGVVRVPAGDEVRTFVPIGTTMGMDLGLHVDTGNVAGKDLRYEHTYGPGALMPNFTFIPLGSGLRSPSSVTVSTVTTLNSLLRPGEGNVWIAACASVDVPYDGSMASGASFQQRLEDAFSRLPVHTPGSSAATESVSVTVSPDGVLQTG